MQDGSKEFVRAEVTQLYTYMHAHIPAYTHTHLHTYIHTHPHTYILHTHTHIHTHTYIHTWQMAVRDLSAQK